MWAGRIPRCLQQERQEEKSPADGVELAGAGNRAGVAGQAGSSRPDGWLVGALRLRFAAHVATP